MNDLQVFTYDQKAIRTVEKEDGLWWVLKDVCEVLDLTNPTMIADRLEADERAKFGLGRQGETWIINEPGLYSVILRSDKPKARDFKRWVTHEVLPAIRRTGEYKTPQKAMSDYQQRMARSREQNARIRKAQLLARLADNYKGTTYQQVLHSYATRELTGQRLLPLPELGGKDLHRQGDRRPLGRQRQHGGQADQPAPAQDQRIWQLV